MFAVLLWETAKSCGDGKEKRRSENALRIWENDTVRRDEMRQLCPDAVRRLLVPSLVVSFAQVGLQYWSHPQMLQILPLSSSAADLKSWPWWEGLRWLCWQVDQLHPQYLYHRCGRRHPMPLRLWEGSAPRKGHKEGMTQAILVPMASPYRHSMMQAAVVEAVDPAAFASHQSSSTMQ